MTAPRKRHPITAAKAIQQINPTYEKQITR